MVTITTNSYEETIALGERLGNLLNKNMVLTLTGDLAGGKTTFTKGLGKGLGVTSIINSPTFTILKIYQGRIKLLHIDAYRLDGADYDLGLDEDLEESVMAVEWPEFYEEHLPKERLAISFKYIDDNTREITFEPVGKVYEEVIVRLC